MQKIISGIAGLATLAMGIFVFSPTVQASGSPHLTLTNSENSWEVKEGIAYTFRVNALPTTSTMQVLYLYLNGEFVNSCSNTLTCSYTIASTKKGEHKISAIGYDYRGGAYSLNTPNQIQILTVKTTETAKISEVTLKSNGEARLGSNGTQNFSLDARARGTNLKTLKITRSDDTRKTVSVSCEKMNTLCALRIYPSFTSSDSGKTYVYEAVATDANGNIKYSEKVSIKVPTTASGTNTPPTSIVSPLKPTVTVVPNVSEITPTQKLTIKGNATNSNGVWGVEVRALPSWSTTALKNRCILNGKPTTGACELELPAFEGRAGQTVKVWTIYWDAKTGLGYSSEMKTIRIKAS